MIDSASSKDKSSTAQAESNPSTSNQTVVFNNATWYIHSNEPKSHKKGKGGPAKRWGHAGVIKDHKLLIYGGNGRNPKNSRHWQCFYELDLLEWEWNKLEPTNNPPPVRDSHSAILVGNDVYIYGGSDPNSKNDEFYRYDLNTNCWERIDAEGDIPPGREGHTACLVQGKYMVIYGGWGSKEEVLTDTYCFDIEKKKWSKVEKKSGPDPKPRESQGSCAIRDYIYIFGGQGENETINDFNYEVYLNDLFRFKLEIEGDKFYSVWEELKPQGPKPTKRSSPSVCTYKDRYIFIIGGEGYSKDFDEESPLGANPKKQRDILKKNQRNEDENILLFPKSDAWYYDTELNVWTRLKIKNPNDFIPHFAHTSNDYDDFIIVFGGLSTDYNTPHDDICILSLTGVDPAKYTKTLRKKKKETEDSLLTSKSETKESAPQPTSTIQTKSHAPLCQLCKNRLTNSYNALTATHHSAKIFEPKIEEFPKIKPDANLIAKSSPVVTGAFLQTMSQLIGWPFAAIGLLIDNSLMMEANNLLINFVTKKPSKQIKDSSNKDAMEEEKKATEVVLNVETMKDEEKEKEPEEQPLMYLQLVDDGNAWTPEEFCDLLADYDATLDEEIALVQRYTQAQAQLQTANAGDTSKEARKDDRLEEEKQLGSPFKKQYTLNLKTGGFRLGNTIVIFSKGSVCTCLGYISIEKLSNMHTPGNNAFLVSCWDYNGEYKTANGEKNKQLILAAIKDFISEVELEEMINKSNGTKVLVMNLKKVPISKKEGICREYELISVRDKKGVIEDIHIRTLDQELKRRLQSEIHYPMLEYSLMTYLRLFFLEPNGIDKTKSNPLDTRSFDIHFNGKKIDFINVKKMMEQRRDEDKELFVEFSKPKMFDGLVGWNREYKGKLYKSFI